MADAGIRVALLARAGKARDQLHRALSDAGASIVAEGDPAELDPVQVASHSPTIFLVSLEPAMEAALDRFDDLLSAEGVEVMFDEAEVTSRLDGWDLNRWARHLATKVLGANDLPPVPAGSPAWPDGQLNESGAPPTPAELMDDARLEDYTSDASELADSIPVSPSLLAEAPDMGMDLDLDMAGLDFIEASPPAQDSHAASAGAGEDFGELDFDESISYSSFSAVEAPPGDLDADVAELAAQLEAFDKREHRAEPPQPVIQTEAAPTSGSTLEDPVFLSLLDAGEVGAVAVAEAEAVVATARTTGNFDFSNLALAPMEGEAQAPAAAAAHEGLGAIVILAGLGGPDAVRQLLSSLPEKLAMPVLLYQHLEVGKHERLVEQLAKISRLPVVLAKDGGTPEGGKVTLLPAGMTAISDGSSMSFSNGTLAQLISALPPSESMVIVLSGADPQLVPMILAVRDAGGLVMAQDPEVCFDAVAAEAMQRQGAAVYPALGLARQVAARWSL